MRSLRAFGLVVLVVLGASAAPPGDESLFVLVRHAEKVDDGADPALSSAGMERAQLLRTVLADSGIDRVYTTDTTRTRDTARPLAESIGAELRLYDARELEAFARELLERRGRALIVGHSNTTAELAEYLGGDGGEPIREDEYDRMYLISRGGGDPPVTTLLRYGGTTFTKE